MISGPKKFAADLSELQAYAHSRPVPTSNGGNGCSNSKRWIVHDVRTGDEEGSFKFDLVDAHAPSEFLDGTSSAEGSRNGMMPTTTINIFTSDTSEYPHSHTFFGYTQDDAFTPQITDSVQRLPDRKSCTVRGVVEFFLEQLSPGGNIISINDHQVEDEVERLETVAGGEDMEMLSSSFDEDQFDEQFSDEEYLTQYMDLDSKPCFEIGRLGKDFTEARAAGYGPGIVRANSDEFYLSISLPAIDLTAYIPSHALLAWDRHFLQPGQRLTLLISGFRGFYPVLGRDGSMIPDAAFTSVALKFKLGFSSNYKPPLDQVRSAFSQYIHTTVSEDGVTDGPAQMTLEEELQHEEADPGAFRRMSLSDSLEDLMDKSLMRLIRLRRRFGLGWAAAEELLWQSEVALDDSENIFSRNEEIFSNADKAEKELAATYRLPDDPMGSGSPDINLITTAFAFLTRRLALCARHCVICHKRLENDTYGSLKPYACTSNLCIFQYYALNFGPSLEYEVATNTETVDLLVSLVYVAAAEGTLEEPFPHGMGLRVPAPTGSTVIVDDDGLCAFDALPVREMCSTITALLDVLPPIAAMKGFLFKNPKARLQDMDSRIPSAAWSLLKWCFASCRAHIQELKQGEDLLGNVGDTYRQFRIMTGAPDKEARFKMALEQESHTATSSRYPTIFAFHGSPVKNWHSIIRHGLWYKRVVNGRSYGDGVYFAADGSVSMSTYAAPNCSGWGGSTLKPRKCLVLAEIVNSPSGFVCRSPFYVVNNTDWIMCRYLLVDCGHQDATQQEAIRFKYPSGMFLEQDPQYVAKVNDVPIDIPEPSRHLDKIVDKCPAQLPTRYDQDDISIFRAADGVQHVSLPDSPSSPTTTMDVETSINSPPLLKWFPKRGWVEKNALDLLPPPTESSTVATMALQRELKALHRELLKAREQDTIELLGWHMPSEFSTDNLYQWIIEIHSFDPELPVAKDMEERGVNSVILEIRFPPSFPHSPPFFRVIRPRFLPFSQGGGGHITDGGSICMDLLTSDGWLPCYSVPAILLQIKLAISNPFPSPARLHPHHWDRPYTAKEALSGYTRAAALHGWKVC
ncbi:hypothetical protein EDD16DRAFT_1612745 [Pisolithus croceorrhizus]|nr:hypothetical protein EDD16DRAFT_1612745 [Pisolithus croceorrhizus]KAI6119644.1 hypothetical protein EV401DRAFT_1487523 [Pisolithus croceorrhizus]KAI6160185.1 hypothetical protein EDD17DRAFT_1605735 [Pisolithus thermaeus]